MCHVPCVDRRPSTMASLKQERSSSTWNSEHCNTCVCSKASWKRCGDSQVITHVWPTLCPGNLGTWKQVFCVNPLCVCRKVEAKQDNGLPLSCFQLSCGHMMDVSICGAQRAEKDSAILVSHADFRTCCCTLHAGQSTLVIDACDVCRAHFFCRAFLVRSRPSALVRALRDALLLRKLWFFNTFSVNANLDMSVAAAAHQI
jgi:hypothetical protein